MVTARKPAPEVAAADANNVKDDLRGLSRITTQSLRTLRATLGLEAQETNLKAPPRRQHTKAPVPGATSASARNAQEKVKSNVRSNKDKTKDASITQTTPLQGSSRLKYATEVFNICLKTLSELTKAEPLDETEVKETNENGSQQMPSEAPQSASSAHPAVAYRCIGKGSITNTKIVAQCSQGALEVLRQESNGAKDVVTKFLKREQAALILIDKFITLGLYDLALDELRNIFEQYWKRQKETPKHSRKATIAEMMIMPVGTSDAATHSFVASFQGQLLRLSIHVGNSCIDNHFVDAIMASSSGSPFCNTVEALREGYISVNSAGQQLRTISNALLKLCNSTPQPTTNLAQRELMLNITFEAMYSKIKSWKLLKYKPDIEGEVWTVITRALRPIFGPNLKNGPSEYSRLKKLISCLQNNLEESNFDNALPEGVQNFYADIAENSGHVQDALQLLQEKPAQTLLDERLRTIKIAVLILRGDEMDSATVAKLHRALNTVICFKTLNPNDASKVLVELSRLRKACSLQISIAEQKLRAGSAEEIVTSVQQSCIELIFACLGVAESMHPVITGSMLAKFIEAVLEAEKCASARIGVLVDKSDEALQECAAAVQKTFQNLEKSKDDLAEMFRKLCVRVSNSSYMRYVRAAEVGPTGTTSLKLLEIAVQVMNGNSLVDKRQSAIGMKLERLARAYLEIGERGSALNTFQAAIEHYIEGGALSDAAETSVKVQFNKIWTDDRTIASQLGRALHARLKLLHEYQELRAHRSLLYEQEDLDSLQRFVLLEYQARLLAGFCCTKECCQNNTNLYQSILHSASEDTFRFCRARFVSYMLRTAARFPQLAMENFLDDLVMSKLCKPMNKDETVYLKPFGQTLLTFLALQWEMLKTLKDFTTVRDNVLTLCETLQAMSTGEELNGHVDDPLAVLQMLQAVSDLCRAHMDASMEATCLSTMIWIMQLDSGLTTKTLPECLIRLAERQLFLGEKNASRKHIDRFQKHSEPLSSLSAITMLKYKLLCAQYQYEDECYETCQETLNEAAEEYNRIFSKECSVSTKNHIEIDSLVCKASLLSSHVAYRTGNLTSATEYARKAVKISTSIWASIESVSSSSSCSSKAPVKVNPSENKLNHEKISGSHGTTTSKGSLFWKYFELHWAALSHMGKLAAHLGLYSDALWYYQSARQIALASRSEPYLAFTSSSLALLHVQGGQFDQGLQLLDAIPDYEKAPTRWMFSHDILNRTEAYIELEDFEVAKKHLGKLQFDQTVFPNHDFNKKRNPATLEQKSSDPRVKTSAKRKPHKTNSRAKETALPRHIVDSKQSYTEREIQDRYDALKILLDDKTNVGLQLNGESSIGADLGDERSGVIRRIYSEISLLVSKAMRELSENSVTSVLAETAIALPVRYKKNGRGMRVSLMQAHVDAKTSALATSAKASTPLPIAIEQKLFLRAHNMILDLAVSQTDFCASNMLHVLHRLLSQVVLFSSAMSMPFTYTSSQLVLQASAPKDTAFTRERAAISAERLTKQAKEVRKWPMHSDTTILSSFTLETQLESNLERLPKDWSIFSLSLSEDRKEILVSKSVGGRTPFLLRIPLTRSDSIDQEDDFTYDEADHAIRTIIEQANQLAHDPRGSGDKENRTTWHTERQCLEEQLKAWLANVENLWLGGFRGLFAPYHFNDAIIKNFRQAISNTIDKHLPSRRRLNFNKMDKVELHDHVLEMFLGLGPPDENDLDDAIEDLLYFIVDIVQFSGERNAYDEIGWDEMLVDVLDAMRESHNRATPQRTQHTILILDKELQAFPWESLPCLRHQPVSRMPSLGAIFERIDRTKDSMSLTSGHRIPSQHRGSFVLNPSKDLASTQELFEPLLRTSLPSYDALVGKTPSEDRFASMLSSNDIMLYFGHGSAAQYVRGRTIRALDECAVTLLMGCSSAKMTECGQFESHGMPNYYMLGGSMAVVGNLWDVTDRDIDRFALTTLIEWGLLNEKEHHVQEALSKSRKKKKKADKGNDTSTREKSSNGTQATKRGNVSLAEAVMKARDACILPYLNGAAPVIYGIPVFLD